MTIYLMQLIEDSKIESIEFQHLVLMIDRDPRLSKDFSRRVRERIEELESTTEERMI